jgi:hypothetical protein
MGAVPASRSPNLRQQVRRRERRLARAHDLHYRLADDPTPLQRDLDTLFALHTARWGPRSTFGAREAFHREFATHALAQGWLRLWFLELDGRPRAAWYGFRFGGAESYCRATARLSSTASRTQTRARYDRRNVRTSPNRRFGRCSVARPTRDDALA